MSSDQLRPKGSVSRIAVNLCLYSCVRRFAVAFGIMSMSLNAFPVGRSDVFRLSPDSAPKRSSTCASCHEQIFHAFTSNPHAQIAPAPVQDSDACVACHGSGEAHIASGGERANIISFGDTPPVDVNRVCMTCHSKSFKDYIHSAHGMSNLSCVTCHTVHKAKRKDDLLKQAQPELCLGCHSDVMPSFSRPSHHPIAEGQINCTDCHNPHGTDAESTVANATCTKCHTRQAGPFAFEHKAVSIEGCISCHSPHGSENAKLLKRGDINSMCLLCHSVSGSISHTEKMHPAGHADGRTAQKACCTDCHTHFHGSNADKDFLK